MKLASSARRGPRDGPTLDGVVQSTAAVAGAAVGVVGRHVHRSRVSRSSTGFTAVLAFTL